MSNDELGDFFGSGSGGAPAISWDEARVGDSFTGVIVPADVSAPEEAYQTEHATNVAGESLYWAPKGSGRAQTIDASTNGAKNRPVRQAVLTLLTGFSAYEFMSMKAKERAQDDERPDDGARRQFIKGGSLTPRFNEALKKAGVRKPEIGATVTTKLVKRTPNDFGGKTNEFEVVYVRPTEETLAKVKAYVTAKAEAAGASDMIDDTEPPF